MSHPSSGQTRLRRYVPSPPEERESIVISTAGAAHQLDVLFPPARTDEDEVLPAADTPTPQTFDETRCNPPPIVGWFALPSQTKQPEPSGLQAWNRVMSPLEIHISPALFLLALLLILAIWFGQLL